MKSLIHLSLYSAILFSILNCTASNENENLNNSDEAVLKRLKKVDWPNAYAEQDTLLLDIILGEDFQMIDQAGNWYSKRDELDWIKNNSTNNDSFNYEIKRFDILSNGTAIICGTGHILEDSKKSTYQSSNVLVKRNGKWKAILSHVSGFKRLEEE